MNNLAHITTVLPDLLVSNLYVDYVPPQMIQIAATIVNSGTVPASDVRVEWHQDIITGTPLVAVTVSEIAAGGSKGVGMTWGVLPSDVGEHLIYVVVDPEGTITESDETNNSDFAAADVLPDLTLSGSYVQMQTNTRPPDPLPITLVLSNQGVAEAQNVRVRVVQGNPFAETSPVLYDTVVSALEAGGSVVLPADISIPGWEDVYAIADPEWAISEIDKSNNLALLLEFPRRIYLPLVLKDYRP
jgi:subtilase family serine protease